MSFESQYTVDYYTYKVTEINRYKHYYLDNKTSQTDLIVVKPHIMKENLREYNKLITETKLHINRVNGLILKPYSPELVRFLDMIKSNYQKIFQLKGVRIEYELFTEFINNCFDELRFKSRELPYYNNPYNPVYNLLMEMVFLIEFDLKTGIRELDQMIIDLVVKEGNNLKYVNHQYVLISSIYRNELLEYINFHLPMLIKQFDEREMKPTAFTLKYMNQLRIKRIRDLERVHFSEQDTYERLLKVYIIIGTIFPIFFFDEIISWVKEVLIR